MYKLLIVDDEKIILDSTAAIIRDYMGDTFDIRLAPDGESAIKTAETFRPDILLTDIKMKEISGIDLIADLSHRLVPKPICIIMSGYNDFEYAQEAIKHRVIKYILKPVGKIELIETLQESINNIRHKQTHEDHHEKTINEIHETEWESLLEAKGIEPDKILHVQTAVIETSRLEFRDHSQKQLYKKVIEETVAKYLKKPVVLMDKNNRMVVLSFYQAITPESAQKINQALSWIENDDMEKCIVGLSDTGASLKEIAKLYLQAVYAASHIHLARYSKVISYTGVMKLKKQGHMPSTLFEWLKRDIEQNSKTEAVEIISQIFEDKVIGEYSVDFIEKLYTCLTSYIYMEIVDQNELLFTDEDIVKIVQKPFSAYGSIGEIIINLKRCIICICDKLFSQAEPIENPLIKKALLLIRNEGFQNITMADIAERLSISYNYFSILFNEQMGQSFTDYITSLKLEKAQEYFKTTRLTVREVAEKVGYTSIRYFAKLFYKKYNMYPSKYADRFRPISKI